MNHKLNKGAVCLAIPWFVLHGCSTERPALIMDSASLAHSPDETRFAHRSDCLVPISSDLIGYYIEPQNVNPKGDRLAEPIFAIFSVENRRAVTLLTQHQVDETSKILSGSTALVVGSHILFVSNASANGTVLTMASVKRSTRVKRVLPPLSRVTKIDGSDKLIAAFSINSQGVGVHVIDERLKVVHQFLVEGADALPGTVCIRDQVLMTDLWSFRFGDTRPRVPSELEREIVLTAHQSMVDHVAKLSLRRSKMRVSNTDQSISFYDESRGKTQYVPMSVDVLDAKPTPDGSAVIAISPFNLYVFSF